METKMIVMGLVNRDGKLAMKYINKLNIANIKPILEENIDFDNANINTDESPLYKGYKRNIVNHSKGIYSKGNASTNSIEVVFSLCKRRVHEIHHQITSKYINKYINSFCFNYNNRNIDINSKFDIALSTIFGKKLMYRELVN